MLTIIIIDIIDCPKPMIVVGFFFKVSIWFCSPWQV